MHKVVTGLALVAGVAIGWAGARWTGVHAPDAEPKPEAWVARVGDEYIGVARFIEEMERRGGRSPGQYHDLEQKQALLEELVYQKALVAAARAEGIDELPEVRRTLDQVLANQVLQRQLRERQQAVVVPDQLVREFYDANADSFAVPARRRVAMIHIPVPADATDAQWQEAEAEAERALAQAEALPEEVRHFGAVAREFSHDQSSRYRGGVIGWLSEGQRGRYRHDPALLDAAFALSKQGETSPVVRGADGVYVVRLVDLQPAQARAFAELEAGIGQRLLQERVDAVTASFRAELLARLEVDVDEQALAAIEPLSPPAPSTPPQPPALPVEG